MTRTLGNTPDVVYVGYVGGTGGEAIQMLELATAVAARGKNVLVIVPQMASMSALVNAYEARAVPGLRFQQTPLVRFGGLAQSPLNVLRLLHPLRRTPVVHLHTGDICIPRMTLLALEALRFRGRVFATIHCAEPEMTPGGARARFWASSARRRFQRVICPSQHGRETQLAYGLPARCVVTIHNGIEVARFSAGNAARARQALPGLPNDALLILFASRFHPQKRPLDAVNAFARIAADVSRAHLALVGRGPLEEELRARAAVLAPNVTARIHFPGHQSNIPDWLAAASCWLLPTEGENFSLAVIEALAAGCPVLSTPCHGNNEILVAGENAALFPVGDVAGCAAALKHLLRDPAARARLGAAGRRTAAHFDLGRMADAHLACYNADRPCAASAGAAMPAEAAAATVTRP